MVILPSECLGYGEIYDPNRQSIGKAERFTEANNANCLLCANWLKVEVEIIFIFHTKISLSLCCSECHKKLGFNRIRLYGPASAGNLLLSSPQRPPVMTLYRLIELYACCCLFELIW